MKIFTVVTTTVATLLGLLIFIDDRMDDKIEPVYTKLNHVVEVVDRMEVLIKESEESTVAAKESKSGRYTTVKH